MNIVAAAESLYTWEGQICNDEEVLLVLKSRADLFEDALVPTVQAAHPYDVPEILALPVVMGSRDYLDWIQDVTQ